MKVPFLSMVNLIAKRQVIPEFIQDDMTALNLVNAASELLSDPVKVELIKEELRRVRRLLERNEDPFQLVGQLIANDLTLRSSAGNPRLNAEQKTA